MTELDRREEEGHHEKESRISKQVGRGGRMAIERGFEKEGKCGAVWRITEYWSERECGKESSRTIEKTNDHRSGNQGVRLSFKVT